MNARVRKTEIFIFLILLTYLKPYNVVLNQWLNIGYQFLKVILTLVLVLTFVLKKRKLSRFTIRGGGFLAVWVFSMLYNTGSFSEYFQVILSIIGIFLLIDYYQWTDKFLNELLSCISVIAKIYFVLNTITVLTQKPLFGEIQVSYLRYFLGGDNYWAFILIPLCGLMFFRDIYVEQRIRIITWIFAFMGFFNLAYQFSVTGMVAYALYLMYMIFLNISTVRKIFKIRNVIIIGITLVIIAVFLDADRIFGPILSVIGKDGFNSRNIIWGLAINAFKKKWLFGYGLLSTEEINSYILYGTDHTHNILLELLMLTGLVGTVVFVRWFYSAVVVKRKFYKDKGIQILQGCMIAFLVCSIFDFYIGLIYMYLFLGIMAVYKHKLYTDESVISKFI